MRFMLSLGLASALLAAASASATQYLFTIGGGSTATGTLTVANPVVVGGSSLITAITGTYNGQAITGLAAPGGLGGNDNFLYVAQPSLLDILGFTFNGAFGDRNIFSVGSTYFDLGAGESNTVVNFQIREVAPGVPEPATWAMMLVGFGAIGLALRRRARAARPSLA